MVYMPFSFVYTLEMPSSVLLHRSGFMLRHLPFIDTSPSSV